ncbi:MAG: PAS domain-containing protein [Phycisphaeraceae bacterium]
MRDFQATTPGNPSGLASVLAELTRQMRDRERTLDEALDGVLALGCRRLGLDVGVVARVRGTAYDVRSLCAMSGTALRVGQTLALGQTYCEKTLASDETFSVSHAAHTPLAGHPCYRAFNYESYIGTPIRVNGRVWGTLSFASRDALGRGFDPQDRDFVELLAAVLESEMDRDELQAKMHAALEESEHARRETQAVLDRLPAMVWRKDTEGNILQATEAAARAAGVLPDDMAGQPAARFYPDHADEMLRDDREVIRSGKPRLGVVQKLASEDGRTHYFQTDKMPTRNTADEIDGVVVVSTDITHLKQAEDELRSMNVRFRAFMNNSPAIKWAVDEDGRYVFVNPAFEQMMAVKAAECVGKTPEEVLEGQTADAFEAVARQAGLLDDQNAEAQTIHVDLPVRDRIVPLMVTRFTYTDAKGAVYVGGSAVDLTEVAAVQRELAQRNKDLKALLYVISHDLREPLRAIRNFSGLVVEREYESLGQSSQDMLNRVIRGAERLDQLLSDVLTLSRAQRAEPATGLVSSGQIVKEVLGDLQDTVDRTGATVQVAADLPQLKVDAFWLRQAIHNLVTNALKFTTDDQTPQLWIRSYDCDPSTSDAGKRVGVDRPMKGLVFEDRGPGVEPHQRERVFGLFQRGVGRDVPGTGAGLAIVAQVAERYGGRVWVEDAPEGGSRFILAFY